jgi:phage baseplate assembly protein W
MAESLEYNIVDTSLFDSINVFGQLVILTEKEALLNAIRMFLCSFRGERINVPNQGGILMKLLLKPVSEERIAEVTAEIRRAFSTEFEPAVSVSECKITFDEPTLTYYIELKGFCPTYQFKVEYYDKIQALYSKG